MNPFTANRAALALAAVLATPLAAWPQVSLTVAIAPPVLPVYSQPPIPGDGYIWTPGYWAWDPDSGDYVWVPGTWVLPPSAGLLWTPGYWAFFDGGYRWHRGYWGRHVGYYGGINYGYGYIGNGYAGGRWDRGRFRYNSAVNNIPRGRVHDVYRAPVPQRPVYRESFNGGGSPWHTPPSADQRRFEGGRHPRATPEQERHEQRAIGMPEQRLGNNHGAPPTAATPRPGGFGDPRVEHVRPAPQMRPQPGGGGPGMARPEGPPNRGAGPRGEPRGQPHAGPAPHPQGERGGNPHGDQR
jgi:hypothetical protein